MFQLFCLDSYVAEACGYYVWDPVYQTSEDAYIIFYYYSDKLNDVAKNNRWTFTEYIEQGMVDAFSWYWPMVGAQNDKILARLGGYQLKCIPK